MANNEDLKKMLYEGLAMEISQLSDFTKVSFQMERLSRTCRLKGINVFEFLKQELGNVSPEIITADSFECSGCGRKFKSQAALTGHRPNKCKIIVK
ncbi:hypothetical protein VB264_16915 [Arcicella aquatica]|uniref:C2H2-type domain-containing protein n=1 Tax=Arcicella aquatica TaxID=217141 RepID=A0ABU5QQY4_9BACT|nr:hypothetical protein [Arcicella aquatica]MEA5259483.1 hypothetical protein [Arcicella aquatica]